MAAPLRTPSVSAFGTWKWAYVPTVSSVTAPLLTEATATGGLDLSCFLFASSTLPSQETNMIDRIRRMCEKLTYQGVGTTKVSGGELHYAVDPQGAANSDAKKAATVLGAFTGGVSGFLIGRLGPLATVDFASGQFVDVYPVSFGPGLVVNEGDDEAAEAAITQSYGVTGPIGRNVALA